MHLVRVRVRVRARVRVRVGVSVRVRVRVRAKHTVCIAGRPGRASAASGRPGQRKG